MGGLRPFNTQKVSREFLEMVEGHWRHVHEETGLHFNDAALHRKGFVYDTEPACRAVVTARAVDPALAMPMLKSIHRAFYHHGRDVTSTEVLADLASAEGLDRTQFVTSFVSTAMREDTRADFSSAQQMGVTGFPTLAVAYPSGQLFLLASGYTRADVLIERLARIEDAVAKGAVRRVQGDD
jgi:putative protein-disulfide isomerase